jgi:hypothetical protein
MAIPQLQVCSHSLDSRTRTHPAYIDSPAHSQHSPTRVRFQDQLKGFKLKGATTLTFTLTQKNRVSYCTQLQALLHEAHGAEANDLNGDDSGCDGDGVVRKVRRREGRVVVGQKRKGWQELNGYWWKDTETFDIERLLAKKVEQHAVGKVRCRRLPFTCFVKPLAA